MGVPDASATSPAAGLDSLPGPEPCTDPPAVVGGKSFGSYTWKNVTILGGGFVTGIAFSPATGGKDVIYARTDVGGAYRWDAAPSRWTPITDWVGAEESNLTGIESIAPDPRDPAVVYMAAGQYITAGNGKMLRSSDTGQTWTQSVIGVPMGGNADGRNLGERLAVDPNLTSTLYFGSRNDGLWRSADSGATWSRVTSFPATGDMTYGISFVLFDNRRGVLGTATPTIYVGVSTTTATSLYRTTDAGATWQAVPRQPPGLFPHHGAIDDSTRMAYFPFNDSPGPNGISSGAIWKLDTSSDVWTDVTPPHARCGFGGLSVAATQRDTVIVSTIDCWPDEIFRTTNGGATWTAIGPQAIRDPGGAQWLYWHGGAPSATGWMGDIEIDPHNGARALYITGQGIWWTDDVTSTDMAASTHWTFRDEGLEETVATGLISPPGGAHLLSAVGDIGGFRHDNLDISPPTGMFGSPIFGTTTGIDFAERHPSVIVRVGTTGLNNSSTHGAYSLDGGTTWSPFLSEPVGGGSGSIAVSADGATLVWAPQTVGPMAAIVGYSRDRGATWVACQGLPGGAQVAADRVNPNKFYAIHRSSLFVSTDGGATFAPSHAAGLPPTFLQDRGQVRPVFGIEGDLWLAAGSGLYHSTDSGSAFVAVAAVQSASGVGFGRGASCQSYPVLYLTGTANGVLGIYRSDDSGATFRRIDDSNHRYGNINHVSGDPRSYGRVYLGSDGRGILYGDPQ